MLNVLVMGGTRYFGRRLVTRLARDSRLRVTVASSRPPTPAISGVTWYAIRREEAASLTDALPKRTWDVVYDQLCFDPETALLACQVFSGRVGRYLMASSQEVYQTGIDLREANFDPFAHRADRSLREELSPAEGKRRAEACFYQRANFPVIAIRFAPVLGMDDPLARLVRGMRQALLTRNIWVERASARITLTHASEASDFLYVMHESSAAGPVNLASSGDISLSALGAMIADSLGAPLHLHQVEPSEVALSAGPPRSALSNPFLFPLSVSGHRAQSNELAQQLGYRPERLLAWLPLLLDETAAYVEREQGSSSRSNRRARQREI